MKLSTAIGRCRINPLRDLSADYLWTTAELVTYFNEAQEEFCEETYLLLDSDTPEICQVIVGVDSTKMARGTNAATLKTTAEIKYYNQFKQYTLAATDNIAMTACTAQAVSTYCKYLVSLDASGNATVQKGTDATTAAAALLPLLTEGLTPIGMFQVATDATHTFTSGTNSLNDAGITTTFLSSDTKFTVDPRVLRVESAELANTSTRPLAMEDYFNMNHISSHWRAHTSTIPTALVGKRNTREYIIWPAPSTTTASFPDKLTLTVARRPLEEMTTASDFEIPEEFVKLLYDSVANKCFGKQDAETFDSEKALNHAGKWAASLEKVKRRELKRDQVTRTCSVPRACL